jgi:hypothetical protein
MLLLILPRLNKSGDAPIFCRSSKACTRHLIRTFRVKKPAAERESCGIVYIVPSILVRLPGLCTQHSTTPHDVSSGQASQGW